MGVVVRKKAGRWFLFINHNGQRKAKCIGESRAAAIQVKRVLEAKLALGDIGVFDAAKPQTVSFGKYAQDWINDHASLLCKPSTLDGYRSVLRQHIGPKFSATRLHEIKRSEVKSFIRDLIEKGLTRSSVRNAISIIRSIFNQAIEDGFLESNPATGLGKFTRAAKSSTVKGVALTAEEIDKLISAAHRIRPEYEVLFLLAARAGLRRGELVALQWSDIEFGSGEESNRYILVQHNYVRRHHTSTKSKKARRVDLSRDLRGALLKLRAARMKSAGIEDPMALADELVFQSADGAILDPDNFYHRHFLPVLRESGIRKIRLHDLRHSFGSLLLQRGASLVYVREQMGHSSIQVTVDIYGHLVPGADVAFVDLLDQNPSDTVTAAEEDVPGGDRTSASGADL